MSTLVTYKEIDGGNVQEISPDPSAAGGLALNTNFRAIADSLPRNDYGASTNPTPNNDSVDTAGIGIEFSQGSRWYNGTAIFECVDPTPTAAVWVQLIGNVGGTINLLEATLNANDGSGTGGTTWNLDGGNLENFANINTPVGCGVGVGYDGVHGILMGATASAVICDGDARYSSVVPGMLSLSAANGIVVINGNGGTGTTTHLLGGTVNGNDGSGSGGGVLNMDGGTLTAASLLQLQPASSAPTPVAGGIYFDGTNFYGCADGTTWKQFTLT